ncbi:MAG: sigma-70 family RNA polymerase sigma factor [Alphaproteobacteria bacterium]|nr:sigma-70 family RNA polymerase sigma factor [Alphaproteobacteria bacterium]MBU1513390.1 sigma-70 family RNA polymerase sigma factor [Alphaproteobacteria bacterium]MBU2096382.1 sigma-70 family RNA polymerase sigma factor [Alphaproteobacteria bacterium]MBU2149926.1 sigma-70 family RNA polymerase sigma factor [Alphaproteobacteria bacterium]MBU2309876.1 sigma-70 family RNA polymerase sigma factor [Alphaproteobacteria bacterium]
MSSVEIGQGGAPPRDAGRALVGLHYDDMRRMARRIVLGDGMRMAFQPTELVNETVIRLIRSGLEAVSGREHLLALASRTMRRTLIDEARKQAAAKRQRPLLLTEWIDPSDKVEPCGVENLNDAITALETHSPEHAQIVELRFGLGLTVEEAALVSGIPERTIKRRWHAARVWLQDYLTGQDAGRD